MKNRLFLYGFLSAIFAVAAMGSYSAYTIVSMSQNFRIESATADNNGTVCTLAASTNSSWTCARTATGSQTLTYNSGFSGTPSCHFQPTALGSSGNSCTESLILAASSVSVTWSTKMQTGSNADCLTHIICMGPR